MLIPTNSFLILRKAETKTETTGGLIIPASGQDQPDSMFLRGFCVAAGPDASQDYVDQEVVYGYGTGFDIDEDGETFTLVDADRCFAISTSGEGQ